MTTIHKNDIYLTRGDNLDLDVLVTNQDGTPYEAMPGDKLYFRMKKDWSDEIVLEKVAIYGEEYISLDESDTVDLPFGSYKYEIEMVTDSNRHYTVIANANFEIGKELERHG